MSSIPASLSNTTFSSSTRVASHSSTKNENIISITFDIFATLMGIITIWQGNKFLKRIRDYVDPGPHEEGTLERLALVPWLIFRLRITLTALDDHAIELTEPSSMPLPEPDDVDDLSPSSIYHTTSARSTPTSG